MIRKYTAQYLRCIQDLVSASGRGRRREKIFPTQTKRSGHLLGRRHALVGPSSARLTARHKLRFHRGLRLRLRLDGFHRGLSSFSSQDIQTFEAG